MLIIFHHLLWVQQSDHSCLLLDHYLYSSSHKNPMVPSAIRTVRWLIIFLLSWLPFKSHFISTFIHHSVSVSVSITSSSTRSSGERKPAFHRRRYQYITFISSCFVKLALLFSGMLWQIYAVVPFVDLPAFNVCLLNCCCILSVPAGNCSEKCCSLFTPVGVCMKYCGKWVVVAPLFCIALVITSSHTEREEFSSSLSGGWTALARVLEQTIVFFFLIILWV